MMMLLSTNTAQIAFTILVLVGVGLFHLHLRSHDNDRKDYSQGTVATLFSIALLIGGMVSAWAVSPVFGLLCLASVVAFIFFVGVNTLTSQE